MKDWALVKPPLQIYFSVTYLFYEKGVLHSTSILLEKALHVKLNMKSKITLKLKVGSSGYLRGWMFQVSVQNRIVMAVSHIVPIRWFYVHWATRLQMSW
jgi:hypothetical protein